MNVLCDEQSVVVEKREAERSEARVLAPEVGVDAVRRFGAASYIVAVVATYLRWFQEFPVGRGGRIEDVNREAALLLQTALIGIL